MPHLSNSTILRDNFDFIPTYDWAYRNSKVGHSGGLDCVREGTARGHEDNRQVEVLDPFISKSVLHHEDEDTIYCSAEKTSPHKYVAGFEIYFFGSGEVATIRLRELVQTFHSSMFPCEITCEITTRASRAPAQRSNIRPAYAATYLIVLILSET